MAASKGKPDPKFGVNPKKVLGTKVGHPRGNVKKMKGQ